MHVDTRLKQVQQIRYAYRDYGVVVAVSSNFDTLFDISARQLMMRNKHGEITDDELVQMLVRLDAIRLSFQKRHEGECPPAPLAIKLLPRITPREPLRPRRIFNLSTAESFPIPHKPPADSKKKRKSRKPLN